MHSFRLINKIIIQAEIPFTNNTHERSHLSAGRSRSCTMQNEQATQHRRLLLNRCCFNHGPVCDVLAWRTSRLDYALFVKGISAWIIVYNSRSAVFYTSLITHWPVIGRKCTFGNNQCYQVALSCMIAQPIQKSLS